VELDLFRAVAAIVFFKFKRSCVVLPLGWRFLRGDGIELRTQVWRKAGEIASLLSKNSRSRTTFMRRTVGRTRTIGGFLSLSDF